jgi:hypothetical protein
LDPRVSVKNIIILLIDRLTSYVIRMSEEFANEQIDEEEEEEEEDENGETDASRQSKQTLRGIPKDINLFEIFWNEIHDIVKVGYAHLSPFTLTNIVLGSTRYQYPGYYCHVGIVDKFDSTLLSGEIRIC